MFYEFSFHKKHIFGQDIYLAHPVLIGNIIFFKLHFLLTTALSKKIIKISEGLVFEKKNSK